ncbi:SRPBCC family protein [Roseiarcaceae bacterium H3SJ34-1]|uniref:SRPBCC family protein n=1 Tax=Terripilifer ovatus TaxID=3032367 RepID=UPI003AB93547|nr:SRPBCC family protein [Roseiarcaceae bacterium H3SJ34-1]
MYAIAASFDVNPVGEPVVISREDMWKGLVQKAEYAVPFVPAMDDCRIIERFEDGFIREIHLRGTVMRERIVFTPDVQVHFTRIDPADGGWIANVMSESEHGLQLTFVFALTFPGVAAGSAEERARGDDVKASYIEAITATIAETRRRVKAGTI